MSFVFECHCISVSRWELCCRVSLRLNLISLLHMMKIVFEHHCLHVVIVLYRQAYIFLEYPDIYMYWFLYVSESNFYPRFFAGSWINSSAWAHHPRFWAFLHVDADVFLCAVKASRIFWRVPVLQTRALLPYFAPQDWKFDLLLMLVYACIHVCVRSRACVRANIYDMPTHACEYSMLAVLMQAIASDEGEFFKRRAAWGVCVDSLQHLSDLSHTDVFSLTLQIFFLVTDLQPRPGLQQTEV